MADLETTWRFLEEGVDHIMTKLQTGVSYSKYMSLYTVSYNYCTSSRMHGSPEAGVHTGRTGANLMGSDLYNKLTKYLIQHLKTVREGAENIVDEALLQYYAKEWDRYTTGANYINRLFTYLNRHWVKREKDEGRKGVYTVYTLALVQWKQNFFNHIHNKNEKLAVAVLRLIEKQRNGENIDQTLVKKVVDSFVSLGLDDLTQTNSRSTFTRTTLSRRSSLQLNCITRTNPSRSSPRTACPITLKGPRNGSRKKRIVRSSPNVSTSLFASIPRTMWEEFQKLLDFDKDEDLQRMYALLSRIPEGLEPLRKKFEEHVKRAGLSAVEKLVGGGDSDVDQKAYVDALLETVNRSFRGEAGFVASLDKACREFLLAKHADALLRKSNKVAEEVDLEDALNQVMVLFKYIEDKDVFQNFYSTKLSKRLIHGLKEACGFEYTNKLQRMFTDMSLSKDLTDQFKEKMTLSHPEDTDLAFSVMVLGTNFWPLSAPPINFVIPKEILPTYNRFQQYYQQKHSGRKLTWLWNYSKNELRTNYANQKYIFMTSAYQMAVLVQYNDYDTLTLDELVAYTGISQDILKQVLGILVKARVLLHDTDGDPYDLNPTYKSKKIKVNLNQAIKAEVKAESTEVLKNVDEDRKYAIQATIVRIMKARKTMKNTPLIQEVVSQISSRFTPKIPDIKKAIDTLLEKEYMERVDGTRDTFAYVA
ncbi:Cullin-domain-containing protein [Phellopilus nigrolimitatus]|nr:Cullin-domain-containing protein [Phellopilus nigrolimitatus]